MSARRDLHTADARGGTWGFTSVTHGYGDTTVLRGLSIGIGPGETVALTGPNGAGKTTAARLLLGLERPAAGTVERPAGASMAAVFQEDRLVMHLGASANLRLVLPRGASGGEARIDAALDAVDLPADARHRAVAELSGGQRRRVAIARAMVVDADLLVLDEPLSGVDEHGREALLGTLGAHLLGRRALVISHVAAELEALGARQVRLQDDVRGAH